ncbi:MAG: hypothetical protein EBR23_01320 [Planctomycetia bacterium]|nr:hypothetical protein [Planctomycetia bacterium]
MRFRAWCAAAALLSCLGPARAQEELDAVVPILEMPAVAGDVVEEESVLVELGPSAGDPQPALDGDPAADDTDWFPAAAHRCLDACTSGFTGPDRFFVVDSVYLQRDNATNNQPIAVHPVRGGVDTVLTSRRLRYDTAPGVRLLYGVRGKDGLGWEAGYLGVYGMFADSDVVDPNGISVPGALGSNVPGFGSAQRLRPKYFSTLNVAEVNALPLEGTFKAGVAGSFLSASADPITTPLAPGNVYRGSRSLRTTSAGLLSTITITAIYRLNDTWGLRAGYDMAWLSGLALAPNQWDFTDTPTSGTTLYGAGGLFLQGASLGLESRW